MLLYFIINFCILYESSDISYTKKYILKLIFYKGEVIGLVKSTSLKKNVKNKICRKNSYIYFRFYSTIHELWCSLYTE